jgi:hypothetical protein
LIASLCDVIFGCWHRNCSFPMRAPKTLRNKAARISGTYIVCLDCGKEFAYDWSAMKVVSLEQSSATQKRGV